MFFQQTHNARTVVEEAQEIEMGAFYLDSPPWIISGKRRLSAASALSSSSRHIAIGEHIVGPSRSVSVESAQPSRSPSLGSRFPGIYSRQSSAVRSGGSLHSPGGFRAHKPTGNPVLRRIKHIVSSSLGLFLLIQTYLCVGAFCFRWLEEAKEMDKMAEMVSERLRVVDKLINCTSNVSCHEKKLIEWENTLVKFPQIYLENRDSRVWSWTSSYYCSFTIISTIGYGNVTPLSVLGRLFAVVYAIIGIPLMLLFITDIGNKLARWTKIAIIKFRKCKYKLLKHFKEKRLKDDEETNEGRDVKGVESERDEENRGEDGEDNEEAGGVTPRRDGGLGIWNIPEVHINIAMSTLDEEGCQVETKDISDSGGMEARYHGYGKDQLDFRDASLHVAKDNSDYGGSSTGVECYIADVPTENAQEIVLCASEDETNLNVLDLVSTKMRESTVTESIVDLPLNDGGKFDSSCSSTDDAEPGDGRPADVVVIIDADWDVIHMPDEAGVPTREQDTAGENAQTEKETLPGINDPDALDVEREMCKNAPSEVLHTIQQGTTVGEKCDKCGQSMQGDVSNLKSRKEGRNSEIVPDSRTHGPPDPKQLSHDLSPMYANTNPPLSGSRRNVDDILPRPVSTYFRHDSVPDEKADAEHDGLSRKKSRSLKDISTLREEEGSPERSHHRPALRGARDRRTSAPNVSFQTQTPKPNGRMPNRHMERCDEHEDPHTDEDRDRNAADSGVASSTSNSTECSPKRRPNSLHLRVEDKDNGGDGILSEGEDDVMDSEEEKSFEKLRQLRFGAPRPSLAGRGFMRVSEADIAMLSIPIWLALLLLLVYLLIGAGCFASMQEWSFLDGFYYCFISLSTIGFGDLVFLPQNIHIGLTFSFLYSFFGLCFTSMCMSLSSMELTLLSRKLASKFGVYRGRIRSLRDKRWASRRRKTIRVSSPDRGR